MPVTGTFGTVEYRDNGEIRVPVIFGEAVIVPSKTICNFSHVSGDDLTAIANFYIIGEDTLYELVLKIAEEKKGSFRLNLAGSVFKTADSTWDTASATAVKNVDYSTVIPRVVDFDIPATYTPDTNFDVRIAYNVPVTGLSDNNVQSVFLLEGAANVMGTPTPYKWVGDSAPDFNTTVPDDLTDTDWQQLSSPPAGVPITPKNDFDENGFWHGDANEGQYFLIRWTVQEGTTGIFSMTPREGNPIRGPVA